MQYTRNGQFSESAQGLLVDANGNKVLSQSGQPIKVGAGGSFRTRRSASSTSPTRSRRATTTVHRHRRWHGDRLAESGVLEASGVDAARDDGRMIASLNTYQSGQQAIQAINETMQAAPARRLAPGLERPSERHQPSRGAQVDTQLADHLGREPEHRAGPRDAEAGLHETWSTNA